MLSRRNFLRTTATLAAAPLFARATPSAPPSDFASSALSRSPTPATSISPSSPSSPAAPTDLKIGMAGYTLREFTVDEALRWMQQWAVRYWAVRRDHLPLNASDEAIAALKAKAAAAGVEIYTAGVITLNTEEEIRPAFTYAQKLGIKMIVAAPALELLPSVEKAVRDTDIRVAIHNHGPDVYKEVRASFDTPDSIYAAISRLDRRIGICADIGHTQRSAVDPIESFKRCADRVFDFHVKDVTAATKSGIAVPLGRGIIDIPKFLRTVRESGFQGVGSLEIETAKIETLTGVSESIGYLNGFRASLVPASA